MSRRAILSVALLAGLCLNTIFGAARIMGFHHRHEGELALSRAELDAAFSHLMAARGWQPADAPTYVLIGRVIHHAQANGLPLEELAGHSSLDTYAVGLAAVLRGIALNPADAWAWFNLVDVHQGFRAARVRDASRKRAGDAAALGASKLPPSPGVAPEPSGLGPEDRISVAAIFEALELEPDFYFYHDYLAKLYWDRGLKDEAAREIRESLSSWPRLEAHPALLNQEMAEALAAQILEGIEASSSSPFVGPAMAMRAKADFYEKLGRTDEAIAAWESLRTIGEGTIPAESDLSVGRLEILRGRYRESLTALHRVLANPPDELYTAWVLYYLGEAHSRLGEHEEAAAFYRRHLEASPGSLSGYLALADEEEITGRSAEAERLYIAAVLEFPSEPVTYQKVIEHMRKHGKARQAMSYAEALRKVSPDLEQTEALIEEIQQQLREEAAAGPS